MNDDKYCVCGTTEKNDNFEMCPCCKLPSYQYWLDQWVLACECVDCVKKSEEGKNRILSRMGLKFSSDEFKKQVCDMPGCLVNHCDTKSEEEQNKTYERRAMEWIFDNGKLTGAEGRDLIKYVFNQ